MSALSLFPMDLFGLIDLAFGEDDPNRNLPRNGTWGLPCDVVRNEDSIDLLMDLPGCKPIVKVKCGILTIEAERPVPEKTEFVNTQRTYGKWSGRWRLSDIVDPTSIEASYKDGVLMVSLKLKPESKPVSRTVDVKVG